MTESAEKFDVVLINGHILDDPDRGEVTAHGMTLVTDHILRHINIEYNSNICAEHLIDCTDCLIMPGMINCHSHSGMGLLRGLADDTSLNTWLHHFIFPVEKQWAKPDFVYLGSLVSMTEMVLNGVTTCADGYYFMESTASAAIKIGMRAVIGQGILDVPTPDAPDAERCMERATEFIESCPKHELIRPALFCHSPYLCGPATLESAAQLAGDHAMRLFCHVSETENEVQSILTIHNVPPVAYLNNLGILGENFVAVHATHVTSKKMDIIAETRTNVVHCPESNMKLGSGAAPIAEMLHRKTTVAIGTDSVASNNNLDMIEEMRTASLLAKLVSSDSQAIDAKAAVRMATMEGARALGLSGQVGSLKAGKQADIAVIDMGGIHLIPRYDMISHLVYCARGSDVRDVIIDGQVVVRNREIQSVNQAEIKTRAKEIGHKIKTSLERY